MLSLCRGRATKRTIALTVLIWLLAAGCASEAPSDHGVNLSGAVSSAAVCSEGDPYLWLEDVSGERALDWVRQQNAVSTEELQGAAEFEGLRERLLAILNSKERIPMVSKAGAYLYNFWRDERNVRGLWRRTTMAEYKKAQPQWETVLDLDELAAGEEENWVWKGARFLEPGYDRALISLSRGGADACVTREFDVEGKEFVADGFELAEAKSRAAWRDRDTLYVGTDFGPGSLTRSGYPRMARQWRRGTQLSSATTIFDGEADDVVVGASVYLDRGRKYEFIRRSITRYNTETFVRRGEQWVRIEKQPDAEVRTFGDQLLFTLRSDWRVGGKTWPAGALLATELEGYLRGEVNLSMLFEPGERKSLAGISDMKNHLIVNELENVRDRVYLLTKKANGWVRQRMETPDFGSVSVWGLDPEECDEYFMKVQGFLTPPSLYLGSVGREGREKLKSLPAFFNAEGLKVRQLEAVSRDGTRIPYFQISRKDMKLDGNNPTLLYGYGGFEHSMVPAYRSLTGAAWLERGGVFVLANIRGGGEFGPKWHQAAVKEHRQRAYDDFISVAEDLVRSKVTSPEHLGIWGGSNGGLLVGVMLTQRPELFKAVVCEVPLLDMKRFNKLLAGASWMGEYGNPDKPEDWAYINRYSPYHNVKESGRYPRVLFTTSTRDDRVHPGHARKMVARMKEQGHEVLYYENIEGGHGGAANNEQRAFMSALAYTFLLKELW
ncbi:MAG TPA: prolyl oligopeptidase family serine peptidase [Sedimentisphaerales bacterium]|nr:prolyl oligopeptidase family serine peptidase [Sedimentisphaerales bacterium]